MSDKQFDSIKWCSWNAVDLVRNIAQTNRDTHRHVDFI